MTIDALWIAEEELFGSGEVVGDTSLGIGDPSVLDGVAGEVCHSRLGDGTLPQELQTVLPLGGILGLEEGV